MVSASPSQPGSDIRPHREGGGRTLRREPRMKRSEGGEAGDDGVREPVPGGELGRVDGAGAVRVEDA